MCESVSEATHRRTLLADENDRVVELNRMLIGWANYFCLGPVSKAYRAVDEHARGRLRQWFCGKHQVDGRGLRWFSDVYLHQTLGLTRLSVRARNLRWATA